VDVRLDDALVRTSLAARLAPLLTATLLCTAGCFTPHQNGGLAMPAAQQSDNPDRPFELSPPVNIAVNKDAIVRLVSNENVACSGTLIGDDLVLTAHHCVAMRDGNGRVLEQDVAPESMSIELGGSHLPWGEVGVRAIISPDCGYERGEGDIAILVLTRKLVGIPTLVPLIDSPPPKGETVYPWGYGRCSLSRDPVHLVSRNGGNIDSIYRAEFLGHAAICPGDSGGPALTINDELVGVISASVMDGDERTSGLTHFTRLDVWRDLFAAAREVSNGASTSELPPYRSCSF